MVNVIRMFFPLISGVSAMLLAQALKVLIGFCTSRRFDMSPFTNAGGMPSSHTAMVTALTCSLGLNNGWSSPSFAISLVFSLIVLHDAAGVRFAAGKQARVLNKIQSVLHSQGYENAAELKESIGHTKFEITVGVIFGLTVAWLYWWIIGGARW